MMKLLTPILCFLSLLAVMVPSNASSNAAEAPWRTPDSIPGYPSEGLRNLDPRPPRGAEWSWVDKAENIKTATLMFFHEKWRGRKPIFNYYIVSECPDEDTINVYRLELRSSIDMVTYYRDKFVEIYPQFSYLLKLKLQLSDGPLNDSVFNIPVNVPKDCLIPTASHGYYFGKIELNYPGAAFHEIMHILGSGHLVYDSKDYYSFKTVYGPIQDIGDNTLSWYALALSWSWLHFYDVHPGLVREDFASKLQMNLKYKTAVLSGEGFFLIGYIVTAKDTLESGIMVRPLDTYFKIELKGGVVVPALILRPEEWMRGNPNFDGDWVVSKNREGNLLKRTRYIDHIKSMGFPWDLNSFSGLNALDWYWGSVWTLVVSSWREHVFLSRKPPADDDKLRLLLFSDLRPDLFFCGYVYRWMGSNEEIFIPLWVNGNETHTPSMLPGRWFGNNIECYYSWGPYIYKAPEFYMYPRRIAVGVPASEEIIYDSPVSRRVFKGKWLVNGTEWPGPYLDLDIIGWPVGDRKPWRWKWADGRDPPGCTICPLENAKVYTLRLTGPNGGPIYLDNFTSRYRGYERVPWMKGVTVIYVRYNTTLEPVYEREYFVNFTIPEGFRVLDRNATGWYREGAKIRLPKLSELEVSKGTKLVLEGWKDSSGRIYRSGEEIVVDGPKSFEPVLVRYHLVSVKGPEELRHEGSGWHREGSVARLKVAENVTYVSDVTRYVFLGFRKGNETVSEIEVSVDGPVEVEAVWRREHLITVKSRFLNWTFTDPWFEENATYMFIIPGDFHNLRNGTIVQIKGIETVSGGKKFAAERIEGESIGINMTVGGRRIRILWNVTFTVHGPIEMRIYWTVRYALDVRSPAGVVSIRNSSLPLPATVFVEEGEKVVLDFRNVHLTGDTSRLVLHDVIMDNRSLGPITSLEIEVVRPVSVIAVYRDQILVWSKLRGQDGSIADPDLVVLRSDLGEVVSEGGKAFWLDRYLTLGLKRVEWRVVKAVYKGVDVTVNATVRAGEPGTIAIPAGISGLTVRVRDVLGMPVPFASVVYSGPGGEVKASTDYSGTAKLGVVPNGQGRLSAGLIGTSEAEVSLPPGEHTVVLPVSPYTITLITSLITPTYMVVRRRKNE